MSVMTTALRDSLKTLRLSGMLETLDARLTQAQSGELGHLDFLQVLCQDEISRRETVALERRLRKAKFEQQATLEGFDFNASPKLPAAQIRDLAALRWLHSGESVILFGPVGVGKTHVAQALGHQAVRQGANVRFTKTSCILAELAGGHADRTWDRRMRELIHERPKLPAQQAAQGPRPQAADQLTGGEQIGKDACRVMQDPGAVADDPMRPRIDGICLRPCRGADAQLDFQAGGRGTASFCDRSPRLGADHFA
ncbi:ATP-binding protein [Streptomyces sp. NPDC002573]|uniref:ATP-binding protein n=1 Tax=Streptomyces sp. NPDC002573 TaxID=3364651 RepID=UPI00368C637D